MKKSLIALFAFAAMALSSLTAMAQPVFPIGSGAAERTYSTMINQFIAACPNYGMRNVTTNGSLDNLELLLQNKARAGVIQTDMLYNRVENKDPRVNNLQTLIALHPEEVHFLGSRTRKEGGFYGIGGTTVLISQVDQLNGKTKVSASGGSVKTAEEIARRGELNYQVVAYPTNDEAEQALVKGDVQAHVRVVGAPDVVIERLANKFSLLSMSPALQKKLSGAYSNAVLGQYPAFNQGAVDTVSVQALLVTGVYSSETMNATLAGIRDCFDKNLGEITDQLGSHAKWKEVNKNDTGKWKNVYRRATPVVTK